MNNPIPLIVTYAKTGEITQEHFNERGAISEMDGGFSPEDALTQAHIQTVGWLIAEIRKMNDLEAIIDQQIKLITANLRAKGINPENPFEIDWKEAESRLHAD